MKNVSIFFNTVHASWRGSNISVLRIGPCIPPNPTIKTGLGDDDTPHEESWKGAMVQVCSGFEHIHLVLATHQAEQWSYLHMEKPIDCIFCSPKTYHQKGKKTPNNI